MVKGWLVGVLVAVSAVLDGCAPRVIDADITVFHQAHRAIEGNKVAVVGYPAERNDSLEFKAYRPFVEKHLLDAGFEVVGRDSADYIVLFAFGVHRDAAGQFASLSGAAQSAAQSPYRRISSALSDPEVSPGATDTETPDPPATDEAVQPAGRAGGDGAPSRNVAIEIVEAASLRAGNPVVIFEAHAVGNAACDADAPYIQAMVRAIFAHLPGQARRPDVAEARTRLACS